MKKTLLTLGALLAITLPVGAQTAPTNQPPSNQAPASLRNQAIQLRQDFQNQVEQIRAQFKAQLDAKRAEFQKKLAAIKDQRKKEIVQHIQDQLDQINKDRTDHFGAVVNQIEDVLNRVIARTDKVSGRGLDVSAVRTAIDAAKKAITDARAAVLAQAGKSYTITVSTETKLKDAVKKVRKQLYDDLAKLRDTVKAAREAVRKAATTLAQIPGVDEGATTSPSNK